MRSILSLEVKLVEMPEEETQPEEHPMTVSMDTAMAKMAGSVSKMFSGAPGHIMPFTLPAGLDFRKSVAISSPSFAGLASIVDRYDKLTKTIQLEEV